MQDIPHPIIHHKYYSMKTHLIGLLILCGISFTANSQRAVRVYSEQDNFKKGSYRIMAELTKHGSYTVSLTFQQLTGLTCSEGIGNIISTLNGLGIQQIATLNPIGNISPHFTYSYTSWVGKSINKLDSLYPYLLPGTTSTSIKTSGVYFLGDLIGKGYGEFYAMGFLYNLGDTICATRGGLVYDVFDKAEPRKEGEVFSTKTRNLISIEHNDGTLARYNILSEIKMLVQIGDKVIPGQPLAVFEKQGPDYTMIFDLYYLNLRETGKGATNYFTTRPRFVLGSNEIALASAYTQYAPIIHPIEIITKELSNREIKKLGLKH